MNNKVNFSLMIALALFFLALYIRLQRFVNWNFWGDELFQLSYTIGPFKPVWKRLLYGDMTAFPGDYLLTYPFYRFWGTNKWALVAPHILSTIFGFYFLYAICQVYLKTVWGYLIAFLLMCFNATLIFHAFEFRPYAVLPTLSLGSFYFAYLITSGQKLQRGHKFLIGAFYVFTILFHAYGVLIAGLTVLFHMLNKAVERRSLLVLKEDVRFFAGVFIVAFPFWLWYSTMFGDPYHVWHGQVFDTFQYIPHPWHHPVGFLKGVFGNLIGNKALYFLLLSFVICPVVCAQARVQQALFILLLIVLPLAIICLADLFNKYVFVQRQFIWVMPLFIFLIAWQWDLLLRGFTHHKE